MINYKIGDFTLPERKPTILFHGLSLVNAWGAGAVIAISKRFGSLPEIAYRNWYKYQYCLTTKNKINVSREQLEQYSNNAITQIPFMLGEIQLVRYSNEIYICNALTQKQTGMQTYGPPVRYEAIDECLWNLANSCKGLGINHVSTIRVGCGLAGGDFSKVEPLIINRLIEQEIEVDLYDLPVKKKLPQDSRGWNPNVDFS